MNSYQFSEFWGILCRNFNQDEESGVMKKKEEDYFRSFKYAHPKDFSVAISKLTEDTDRLERKNGYETFPTVGELLRYTKLSQKFISNKKYNNCTACDNSGRVTIILGKKIGEEKTYSRHCYRPGIKLVLINKQRAIDKDYYNLPISDRPKSAHDINIMYYDYGMHCLCDKGRAIKNVCTPGASITPDEFDELLDLYKKKVL